MRTLPASIALVLTLVLAGPALAQTLNVYTAWPESLSQPIFKAYTAKTDRELPVLRLTPVAS